VKRLRGEHVALPNGDTFVERFPPLGARVYQAVD
jgi:hypothetical protein